MKKVYRVLAYGVAAGIVVQAMAIVWAVFGLSHWIEGGGVADQVTIASEGGAFPEELGFAVHEINGSFGVPVLSLLLLIVSFFVHARGAVKWAAIVFVLAVVQSELGYLGNVFPIGGALHGLNALILFTCVLITARRPLEPKTRTAETAASQDAARVG